MEFRINVTIEVDQVGNALAIRTPVPLQLIYRGGRWQAQSESPPVATPRFDTMEEALVAGAKEATTELQDPVHDQPVVVGRITPNDLPTNLM